MESIRKRTAGVCWKKLLTEMDDYYDQLVERSFVCPFQENWKKTTTTLFVVKELTELNIEHSLSVEDIDRHKRVLYATQWTGQTECQLEINSPGEAECQGPKG